MKKLFKLLLASAMVLSLAACSSDDETEDDDVVEDVIEVEDEDWRDGLYGEVGRYTIHYDREERDIIVQILDTTTIYFYFDDADDDNSFAYIDLTTGYMDEEDALYSVYFQDDDLLGYDDFGVEITDLNQERITCKYTYSIDSNNYELTGFDTQLGIPSEEYQNVWCLNADLNLDSFTVDYEGNWVLQSNDGNYEKGYVYQDDYGCCLYNIEGVYVGELSIDGSWLVVDLYGETNYYATLDNSTNGQ